MADTLPEVGEARTAPPDIGARDFAAWVRAVVGGIDWRTYRKSPRGPKKPVDVKRLREIIANRGASR